MRNSRQRDAHHVRSLRSEDIRAYLRERARECDEQIEELRGRINERKRFAATAPPPASHRMGKSGSTSRSLRFKLDDSNDDCDSYGDDSDYRIRSRHRSESPERQHRAGTARGILKSSAAAPSPSPDRPRSTTLKNKQWDVDRKSQATRQQQRSESPDAWFQRIMHAKQLSPLDLCDLFSYGDARKYPTVPLHHVCEVLFELDPEVLASGYDPVTPEMEEFLYQFSFEGPSGDTSTSTDANAGAIVVNVKDALRSLDIWQSSGATPVKKKLAGSVKQSNSLQTRPTESVSPVKSAALETKNRKLQAVVSNLQDANLRLSRQLDSAIALSHSRDTQTAAAVPHQRRPHSAQSVSVRSSSASRSATSLASLSASSLSSSWLAGSDTGASSKRKPQAIGTFAANRFEDVLVTIASRLQYSGVKTLEELLVTSTTQRSNNSDDATASSSSASSSDFVSLKQLRWLLAEHFGVDVGETQLMESCLGMNFNAQAHVDHREFVHVLLDMLLYASPRASATKMQQLCATVRQYLTSGFATASTAGTRTGRAVLLALCEQYDLESDEYISVAELMRVLFKDVVRRHAMQAPFPLTHEDTLRIIQQFVVESESESGAGTGVSASVGRGFVNYPAFVAALFADPNERIRSDGAATESDDTNTAAATDEALAQQTLDWGFWRQLRKALCSGSRALEPSIHAQLCKIFRKIDPTRRFVVSHRIFARVFDQHLSAEQLNALGVTLAQPSSSNERATSSGTGNVASASRKRLQQQTLAEPSIRFDVFMKLVFGAPLLQDDAFLRERIVRKLALNEVAIRTRVVALLTAHGSGFDVSPTVLHALLSHGGHEPNSAIPKATKDPSEALLTMCELLYLFASLDDAHAGRVALKSLWSFLKTECWSSSDTSNGGSTAAQIPTTHTSSSGRTVTDTARVSTRRALAQCLDAYNLERALARYHREQQGCVSQDQLLQEIHRMLTALGRDDDTRNSSNALDPASLQQLVASIAAQIHDADADLASSGRLRLALPIDAFFDALFDWPALARALHLPQGLGDAKHALELFDWNKDGCIAVADWNKAWRQISARSKVMAEWELRVLQRRFPGAGAAVAALPDRRPTSSISRRSDSDSDALAAIDYARLLVHLMDAQHERARRRVKRLIVAHFRDLGTAGAHSAQQIDKLFRRIDVDNKGHFNVADLAQYSIAHVIGRGGVKVTRADNSEYGSVGDDADDGSDDDDDDDLALVQNVNVMGHALAFLASGGSSGQSHSAARATTVMRARFHEFMRRIQPAASPTAHAAGGCWRNEIGEDDRTSRHAPPLQPPPRVQVITSLRALELAILNICSDVASVHGVIQPTRAFRYLSDGSVDQLRVRSPRSRSRSPTRSASRSASYSPSHSPSRQRRAPMLSPKVSMMSRSQIREVEAMALDPLTPAKLQRVLRERHGLEVSSFVVTQFFEHIGARSQRLLELLPFAQWVAPLSLEMANNVRVAVKKMAMRGKGGGGRVDLDRFLGQIYRKLLEAPLSVRVSGRDYHNLDERYGGDEDDADALASVRVVPLALLQSKLQQLGIPLSRRDMETLLLHFGMDEDAEAVDVALFLQRVYELSASPMRLN